MRALNPRSPCDHMFHPLKYDLPFTKPNVPVLCVIFVLK